MKRLIFILVFTPFLFSNPIFGTENSSLSKIENGWYYATVKYYNYNTYTRSTYTLAVKVEYDRVTAIDFGNGGSVHTGYNNSGYTYSGGYLYTETNYYNNSISLSGKVTIYLQNGNTLTYDILIE